MLKARATTFSDRPSPQVIRASVVHNARRARRYNAAVGRKAKEAIGACSQSQWT
jgi:hypothetical protein